MIDLIDFKKTVDNKFWKHITKDTLFCYGGERKKEEIIEDITNRVNGGVYVPEGAREFIIFNKNRELSNRVARIVPSFSVSDYLLIYYILKKIEENLSKSIHPNAFGSFRNFKYFRDQEEKNHELLGFDSLPSVASASSFYKNYWIFEWREFMGKARRIFQNKKHKYFILFDISDFYSSIDLLLLERKVRGAISKEKQTLIDILFYFLQHSNNKFKKYVPEVKGIPQDEVGDTSRALANYFLQTFDYELNDFAASLKAEVLRFADDFIIYAKDKKTAEKILFYASMHLQKIGLSINGSKVKDMESREKFKKYWAFDIHELLDKNKYKKSAKEYLKRKKDNFRWFTVLSRFLRIDSKKIDVRDYMSICKEFLKDELIGTLDHEKIIKLFYFLPESERNKFLKQLYRLADNNNFNSYHFNLIKAISKNDDFKKYFDAKRIEKINHRIQELKNYFC